MADEGALWLFIEGFKRIEAPGLRPYPHSEAIRRTLAALALAFPGDPEETIDPAPGESIEDILEHGAALQCQGKFSAALSLFQYATEHATDSPTAWANLASARSSLEQFDDALSAYEHAIQLDPGSADLRNNRAWVLNTVGRFHDALSELDTAAAIDPGSAAIWNNMGWALVRLARYVDALAAFDKAIALEPHDSTILSNRGAALHNVGRLEEAWQSYQDALTFDPGNKVIALSQARVVRELSRILDLDDPQNAKYRSGHQVKDLRLCIYCSNVAHNVRRKSPRSQDDPMETGAGNP